METQRVAGPLGGVEHSRPDREIRVADVIIDILAKHGVDTIFGLPGGAVAPLNDALLDKPHVRFVTTRHEAGAVFAAAGYARTSGRLGVALVTSGPGLLNAATGLASAFCDGLPVLLLGGEVPRSVYGRGALQEGSSYALNLVGMLSHVSKMAVELPEPNAVPSTLRRAIATALSGRPGPVAVSLPLDVTSSQIRATHVELGVSTQFHVHPQALEPVVELFKPHTRSVLFAGSGVRNGDGARALRQLAEHLQIPVMTTPKAKGVFPESHPLSLGVFGLGGNPSAHGFLRGGVDVILAVGTSLGDVATDGWSALLRPNKAFVHVDIEAGRVGRSYPADISIVAPATVFLDMLRQAVTPTKQRASFGVTYHAGPPTNDIAANDLLEPHEALREIQKLLPDDTIFVVDSGEHTLFATHYLRVDHSDGFIAMTGLGSMGSSIGAAIGAKLAKPERPVAVIIGDGGFSMVGTEVNTAVQAGVSIHVFVFNNGSLSMCEIGHENVFGRRPRYPVNVDVVRVGAGLGAKAMSFQDFVAAGACHEQVGPIVIDVPVRTTAAPKNDRIASLKAKRQSRTDN